MESLALFDEDLRPAVAAAPRPAPAPAPSATAARARSTVRTPSAPLVAAGPTVLAVDGNSLAHRGYHAYAGHRDSGDLVGAGVYGFLALLAGVVDTVRPSAIVVGFDCRQDNVRKTWCADYKAQRPDKPDALDALLDELPEVLDALGAYVVTHRGWEADDVCGSVAHAAEAARRRCVVATSDRDAFALISPTTSVLRLRSGLHRAAEVTEARFRREVGLQPRQYTEYAALRGDVSDNLPGIPGIGRRRARDLLRRYPCVEDAVADPLGCRSVLGRDLGQALIDDLASPTSTFRRNVKVMTIRRDLPVDLDRGRPRTDPATIDRYLRGRRLAGLVARMTTTFGDLGEAPPPPDEPPDDEG